MTLVMLYRSKVKPDAVDMMTELRNEFRKIYDDHGIEVIGRWRDASDPTVSFYMVKYKDEEEYKKKVDELHHDERYLQLTSKLNKIRVDFSTTRLIPH